MKTFYTVIAAAVIACSAKAQIPFAEITETEFPALVDGEAIFGDFDNDGDLDLIITGSSGSSMMSNTPLTALYINDGTGSFSVRTGHGIDSFFSSSMALGDVNNDGNIDIFICGSNGTGPYEAKILTNDGEGNFTPTANDMIGTIQGDAAFGDLDGDGDLDLIVSGYTGIGYNTSLYVNDGEGNFSLVDDTPFRGTNYASMKFFDIENDGDLDVIISGNDGGAPFTELYVNDGSGTFAMATGTPFRGSQLGAIDIADVDDDGDPDVLISGFDGSEEFTELYRNDGTGNFSLDNGSVFMGLAYSSAQFIDFDMDGDEDLIISGYNGGTQTRNTLIYTNDGEGVFNQLPSTTLPASQQFGNKAADIDGDSDPDIYMSGSTNGGGPNIAALYRNESLTSLGVADNGVFDEMTAFPNPTNDDINLNFGENLETFKVELYSLTGKLIQSTSYHNSNAASFQINASAGIYMLKVMDGNNNQIVIKVVKR